MIAPFFAMLAMAMPGLINASSPMPSTIRACNTLLNQAICKFKVDSGLLAGRDMQGKCSNGTCVQDECSLPGQDCTVLSNGQVYIGACQSGYCYATSNESFDEYCGNHSKVSICTKGNVCCTAMTASCLSCAKGISVKQYCDANPGTSGCPQLCCQAQTASCLACADGTSVSEYCKKFPSTVGCPQICCQAQTASCLSCASGLTIADYCGKHPSTIGCPGKPCGWCTSAASFSCGNCDAGLTCTWVGWSFFLQTGSFHQCKLEAVRTGLTR